MSEQPASYSNGEAHDPKFTQTHPNGAQSPHQWGNADSLAPYLVSLDLVQTWLPLSTFTLMPDKYRQVSLSRRVIDLHTCLEVLATVQNFFPYIKDDAYHETTTKILEMAEACLCHWEKYYLAVLSCPFIPPAPLYWRLIYAVGCFLEGRVAWQWREDAGDILIKPLDKQYFRVAFSRLHEGPYLSKRPPKILVCLEDYQRSLMDNIWPGQVLDIEPGMVAQGDTDTPIRDPW